MVGKIMSQLIEVRQGDSFTIQLQFQTEDGLLDITDAELKMQVRNREDNKVLLTKTGIIDDASKGKAHLTILPADTKNLAVEGDYITDIQATFANGEIHTVYPGDVTKMASFVVSRNVTK